MSLKTKEECYFCSKKTNDTICKSCKVKENSINDDILDGINFEKLINKHTYDFIIKFDKYCLKEKKSTVMPMEIDNCA